MFDTRQISGWKRYQAALYKHQCNQLERTLTNKLLYYVKQPNDMASAHKEKKHGSKQDRLRANKDL
jgi:hypothetical protein